MNNRINFIYKDIFDYQTQEIISFIENLHLELFQIIFQRLKSLYNIITYDIKMEDIYTKGLPSEGIIIDEKFPLRLKINFIPFNFKYYDMEDFQVKELISNRIFLPQGTYNVLNGKFLLTDPNPNVNINPYPFIEVFNDTVVSYQKEPFLFLTYHFDEENHYKDFITILNPLLSFYERIISRITNNVFSFNISPINPHKNIITIVKHLKSFLYQPTYQNTVNLLLSLFGKYIPSNENVIDTITYTNHPFYEKIRIYPSFDYIVYKDDLLFSVEENNNNNHPRFETDNKYYVYVVNKTIENGDIFFTRMSYSDILKQYKPFSNLNIKFTNNQFEHSRIKTVKKFILIHIHRFTNFGPLINHFLFTLYNINQLLPLDIRIVFDFSKRE